MTLLSTERLLWRSPPPSLLTRGRPSCAPAPNRALKHKEQPKHKELQAQTEPSGHSRNIDPARHAPRGRSTAWQLGPHNLRATIRRDIIIYAHSDNAIVIVIVERQVLQPWQCLLRIQAIRGPLVSRGVSHMTLTVCSSYGAAQVCGGAREHVHPGAPLRYCE